MTNLHLAPAPLYLGYIGRGCEFVIRLILRIARRLNFCVTSFAYFHKLFLQRFVIVINANEVHSN